MGLVKRRRVKYQQSRPAYSRLHENYQYCIFNISELRFMRSNGFNGGHISEDKNWVVGDAGDRNACDLCPDATLPDWMVAIIGSSATKFNHAIANEIRSTKASSQGASDGWFWEE